VDAESYLAATPWDVLQQINALLCQSGGYQVGVTSEGYEPAKVLWEENRSNPLAVMEVAELCRKCHRLAPFLFLNGNTFVSCARVALEPALSSLPSVEQFATRAAIGHYIAGTIGRSELLALVPASLQ